MTAACYSVPGRYRRARRIAPTALVWLMTCTPAGLAVSEQQERSQGFDDKWLKTVRIADATRRERGFYGGVPTATTGSLDWSFEDGKSEVGLVHVRDLLVIVELEVRGAESEALEAFNLFRGLVMRTIVGLVAPREVALGDWDVAIWSGLLLVGGLPAPIVNPPPEVVWSWALIEAACGSLALPLDDGEGTTERNWTLDISKPRGVTLALTSKDEADDSGLFEKECSARIGYGDVAMYRP